MYEVDTKELKIAMVEAGIKNITELSKASGVNRNTTAEVISGEIYPSSMVMARFVAALGIGAERAGRIFFKQKLTESVR